MSFFFFLYNPRSVIIFLCCIGKRMHSFPEDFFYSDVTKYNKPGHKPGRAEVFLSEPTILDKIVLEFELLLNLGLENHDHGSLYYDWQLKGRK